MKQLIGAGLYTLPIRAIEPVKEIPVDVRQVFRKLRGDFRVK